MDTHKLIEHMAVALMQAEKFIAGEVAKRDKESGTGTSTVLDEVRAAIREYEAEMIPF